MNRTMIKHSKLCIYVCLKCNLYVDITTKISDNHEICRGKKIRVTLLTIISTDTHNKTYSIHAAELI